MRTKSFFGKGGAVVSLLCRPTSVDHAVALARTAFDAGADGVTVELNDFPLADRTVEGFREIISSVQLPFMFTDYREDVFLGEDDEARMESLMTAAKAGAEFVDVMADLYCPLRSRSRRTKRRLRGRRRRLRPSISWGRRLSCPRTSSTARGRPTR